MTPLAILRRLHRALEGGAAGDALREHFTDDAVTDEYPNRIKPEGGRLDLATIVADSVRGAGLLRRQRYDVHTSYEVGDTAIVRLTWTGEVARNIGPFSDGQVLTAHIAQFVETRAGRVSRIATYDCYEPF
ncbi:nuclear transport factor 2 family protein [Leifsonia poae]|uniref:nuclear transport factor 2 family protein n=1 Tax=Leifsonia poae TaxID=110933 RepID=UPI003D69B679